MTDKREQILSRLVAIAEGITGIKKVRRNELNQAETTFPLVVILDGDEMAADSDPVGRPLNAPRIISMTPEIYIVLSDKAADVGTTINGFRAAFLKAIFTDTALAALVKDNNGIRYEGSATGLARGRSMIGEIGLSFSFTYVLRPDSLP